jgi:hypothetical protein
MLRKWQGHNQPFLLLLLLLLPLLWLEECDLLRGWTKGEVRVDINEPATGLTQDRVVLSQGSQMRCRVEPGMDRLRRNISSLAHDNAMRQK